MKIKNANRGITLIALVITIIVLLILAGVSIAMLTGDNGIITKASDAKEKSANAEATEKGKLLLAEWKMENAINGVTLEEFLTSDTYKKNRDAYGVNSVVKEGNKYKVTVTKGGISYEVTINAENGKEPYVEEEITSSSQTPTEPSKPLTGITIAEESITIQIGESKKINTTKVPSDANDSLLYESSNDEIATVDENGNVTGVAEGEVTITVQGAKTTTVKEEITVTVTKPGNPNATTGLFAKSSTINGGTASANNPTIPAGYRPIDVTTGQTPSSWGDGTNAPEEASVKNGLVITDAPLGSSDGNEFVWIPVADIDEMAREISGSEVDVNGNKQYRGVLYNFGTTLSANSEIEGSADSTSYREPANLDGYDKEENVSVWTATLYQEEYNKMVKQVEKYKGFYVGRYETSLDSNNVAQSKNNKTSATAATTSADKWYGLYTKQRAYAPEKNSDGTDNTSQSVVSSMIWGSQYDAMMRWMQSNGVVVTSKTSSDLQNATKNTGSTTGGTSKDIINNIYDIWGNRWEWTQEASDTYNRVLRGGYYGSASSPSVRKYNSNNNNPSDTYSSFGSRLTLYIK